MNESKGFPVRKMKLNLKKIDPTTLEISQLKKQLADIGLSCPLADEDKLAQYKIDVLKDLQTTKLQAYSIQRPSNGFSEVAFMNGSYGDSDEDYIEGALTLVNYANAEWALSDTGAGYQKELCEVQVPAHFDYLCANRPSFCGTISRHTQTKDCNSVDAIKQLYINTAKIASTKFTQQINSASLEAFFANIISPIEEKDIGKDFNQKGSTIIMLTLNQIGDETEGIGVIHVNWEIFVENYTKKVKGTPPHRTMVDIFCRGCFYSNPDVLIDDYIAVCAAFKKSKCYMKAPKEAIVIPVFAKLPEANLETFVSGIPSKITSKYTDSIILHSPYTKKIDTKTDRIFASGLTVDMFKTPLSDISYKINTTIDGEIPIDVDIDIANNSLKKSLCNIEYNDDLDLHRAIFKTDTIRHSRIDGSYTYVESGEFLTSVIKSCPKK